MSLRRRIRAARPALRRFRAVRSITRHGAVRPLLRTRELWRNRSTAIRNRRHAFDYLKSGKEVTNLTYDIANTSELEAFVARVLSVPLDEVRAFSEEVVQDGDLKRSLRQKLATRENRQDEPYFGRRLVWYLIIRILKPAVLVETGIHDGLGAALMVRALERNSAQGFPGKLHSFDIDPAAGWLVNDASPERFELHEGDIRTTLAATLGFMEIDIFIHDSLHTYEQEVFEFEFALAHRAKRLVLITDNARVGDEDDMPETTYALRDICKARGARYDVVREQPLKHFVGGGTAGVGVFDLEPT